MDKKTIEHTINNSVKNITQMKESTAVFLITCITLLIILISFLCYFYYSRLRNKECNNMKTIYGDLNGKIRSVDDTDQFNYTFKDYYIKSAYNCCSGGNYKNDYVDTCNLKYLLKQGVRGLDFEIYSMNDGPVVATSTSDSYYVKETFNYINFVDVMNIIRDYAFSTSTAPNSRDPIIIHLRIKSANQKMYQNFAKLLEQYDSILLSKDYDSENNGKNFGNVPLKNLYGKVIIIVDRSNISFLECQEFYRFVNMTSNSVFMRALHYYDIKFTPDMNELIEFNKQNMTIGMPDKGSNPENPSSLIMREMGCQLLAMRYQKIDVNVEENDLFFDENGYAFVLKPENLRYIPVTIPMPPPQNPELSYATKTVSSDFYSFNI
uniref:phosphoinositide phospholipase C n=1 Tax=viral metagenome TaxID=1070528 RepID=A0A6C0KPD4_9ZZZZ